MQLKLENSPGWLLPVAGGIFGSAMYFVGLARGGLNTQGLSKLEQMLLLGSFVLLGVIVGIFLRYSRSLKFGGMEIELAPIRAERKAIEERIAARPGAPLDIFSVIQLGLNQITEYYTINKSQARNSFRASMGAVVVGLLALSLGIALNYKQPQHTTVPTLSAIAGVLLQFIGGAYFYLYNKTLQQLNFFYETLIRLQDTMLAVQQVDQLQAGARDKTREAIIKALIRTPVGAPRITEVASKGTRGKAQVAKAASS